MERNGPDLASRDEIRKAVSKIEHASSYLWWRLSKFTKRRVDSTCPGTVGGVSGE